MTNKIKQLPIAAAVGVTTMLTGIASADAAMYDSRTMALPAVSSTTSRALVPADQLSNIWLGISAGRAQLLVSDASKTDLAKSLLNKLTPGSAAMDSDRIRATRVKIFEAGNNPYKNTIVDIQPVSVSVVGDKGWR